MLFIGYRHGWRLKKTQVSPTAIFAYAAAPGAAAT